MPGICLRPPAIRRGSTAGWVAAHRSMAECAYRFSPRVPGEVDVPESPQQVSSPLVQRLQPGVFDAPLSAEPTDDKLAVAADRDRERVRPRTDPLQQILPGRRSWRETRLDCSSCCSRTGPAARRRSPPVRRSRSCHTPCRGCQATRRRRRPCNRPPARPLLGSRPASRALGPDAEITRSRPARARLQIAYEVDQLRLGERLRVDIQQPSVCRLLSSPRVTREPIRPAWRPRL